MNVRRAILTCVLLLGIGAISGARGQNPAPAAEEKAVFAGGCFWCMQPPFDHLPGVKSTVVGYTGGPEANPTYAQVSAGETGHREAMEVTFDPAKVTYAQLLDVYWQNISPIQRDGQFLDVGDQYTTAIFYQNEGQRLAAEASKDALARSGKFQKPVATVILPADRFWPAEEYHQKYYQKNRMAYGMYYLTSGRASFNNATGVRDADGRDGIDRARRKQRLDFLESVARGDVLLAVPVEGNDIDENQAFHQARDGRISQSRDEFGMFPGVFDPGVTDDLQPGPVWIIHQEKSYAIVNGEVPGGEQLAVALVIGKGEQRRIDHAEKSRRAAAVLQIRPTVLAHGREIKRIARGNEGAFVVTKRVALGRRGQCARPAVIMRLRLEDGRREQGLQKSSGHNFGRLGGEATRVRVGSPPLDYLPFVLTRPGQFFSALARLPEKSALNFFRMSGFRLR